jgi:hypothetical protein
LKIAGSACYLRTEGRSPSAVGRGSAVMSGHNRSSEIRRKKEHFEMDDELLEQLT